MLLLENVRLQECFDRGDQILFIMLVAVCFSIIVLVQLCRVRTIAVIVHLHLIHIFLLIISLEQNQKLSKRFTIEHVQLLHNIVDVHSLDDLVQLLLDTSCCWWWWQFVNNVTVANNRRCLSMFGSDFLDRLPHPFVDLQRFLWLVVVVVVVGGILLQKTLIGPVTSTRVGRLIRGHFCGFARKTIRCKTWCVSLCVKIVSGTSGDDRRVTMVDTCACVCVFVSPTSVCAEPI